MQNEIPYGSEGYHDITVIQPTRTATPGSSALGYLSWVHCHNKTWSFGQFFANFSLVKNKVLKKMVNNSKKIKRERN